MQIGSYSDDDLLAMIKGGEKTAFDVVYRRHWLRLYKLACRITDDEVAAQDIIQDTFISLWEKCSAKDIRNLEAYLYQAVKFRCFMNLRAGHITKKHLDHFAGIAASQMIAEDDYSAHEMEDVLEECVASLPERCREVYYLSRVEHLPNKQIAERLHISIKTVENQMTKALKQLRLSLNKFGVLLIILLQG